MMPRPTIVYHMLPAAVWAAVPPDGPYRAATLATEGFVHCTAEGPILQAVANRFYRSEAGDWLILAIDLDRLDRLDPAAAPVRWEQADGHLFPHIYGPIARAAVVQVIPFGRSEDGSYELPEVLR